MITSSRNRWPEPANSEPTASWMRAPAESSSQMNGIRFCSAISRMPRDLDLAGHAHRAGHHGEVVGDDRAAAAVDLAPAGDHAVGGRLPALHRALREVRAAVHADLDERAAVDQQVDPLARGQLALARAAASIFSAPPPSLIFARRSCRSSTSGFSPLVSPCSVSGADGHLARDARVGRVARQLLRRPRAGARAACRPSAPVLSARVAISPSFPLSVHAFRRTPARPRRCPRSSSRGSAASAGSRARPRTPCPAGGTSRPCRAA